MRQDLPKYRTMLAGYPSTPTIGTVSRTNDTTVSVPFTAGFDGGSAITSYTVISSPSISLTTTGTSSPLTVTGTFALNQAYTFQVRANNANGSSAYSASSNSITPNEFTYLMQRFNDTAVTDGSRKVAVDGSKNYYITGRSASSKMLIAKFNSAGAVQWQKTLSLNDRQFGTDIAVTSAGTVYVVGASFPDTNGYGNYDIQLVKYNTSGTLQWQRRLGNASDNQGWGIALDSSENVYLGGYTAGATTPTVIAKYNSSGTIQWQRTLSGTNQENLYGRIAVDSSGNSFVCFGNYNGTNTGGMLAKYNTSGTLQWQRRIRGTGDCGFYAVTVDTAGDVYVTGYNSSSGQQDAAIVKYNTSGTVQWQRRISGGNPNSMFSISSDGSNNVYVYGDDGTPRLLLAKYNSSGTIQWQRTITRSNSGTGELFAGVGVDSSGNVYVTNRYDGDLADGKIFTAILPTDGSKTGTYSVGGTSFTYATSSRTEAATTMTDSAGSLTDAAGALSETASSLTEATPTLTATTTTI